MAKGDYFFPLYYQKLLTSTTGWRDDEFGAYLKLLIYQFDNGGIPNDMEIINRIAPSTKKNWSLLSRKFVLNEEGLLVNEVMDKIRNRRSKISETNSKNGSLGGNSRRRIVNQTESESEANANQTVTNNNMVTVSMVNDSFGKSENLLPVGSDKTAELANESWKDQKWREQLCMGLQISEEHLKRWMSQFNASVSQDVVEDFSSGRYKKMLRGWILKQREKGVNVESISLNKNSAGPKLKTLT